MTNNDPNRRDVHGTSKLTAVGKKGGLGWLAWLLAALVLLALLFLLLRSCNHDATTTTTTTTTTSAATSTPPVAIEQITLPGGKTIGLAPQTLNYELQRYLASDAATPRTFTFDHLNFATDSATLPADAKDTVDALAQILVAYPKARVRLNGYADSTGGDPHNVALGAARARTVAQALAALGVAADRMKDASGGAADPVATNATPAGRAENRRTELVVLAK